ncbi:hypothetical protein GCM10011514_14110 [Emticicia aquatilis]|uniref:PKD domain-containing protein n=1 Tax=Emticicia aquatilis TaxID=1537369 RepID=A0A917DNH4_9BACT|nr:hypothetical protein [Emticicia aquatilis]GGD51029.1 hypothetical protein GCM10011514_14110 [Emticicia aquatilis]
MKGIVKIVILLLIFLESVQTKAQSCTGSLGDPVVNVTFGSGASIGAALPTGQTNYTYSGVTCIQDGFYGIRTTSVANATDNNTCYGGGWLLSTRDHTGDTNGYMMVVNASYSPGEFFKTTISGLCGGTTYEFSSWIMNLLKAGSCSTNSQRFPNVTFNIETTSGTVLKTFSTGSIPETSSPQWNRYATFFTTPTGVSTVVLRLVNNAPGGCGNDLALDDIQFRACGPTLTTKFLNTNSTTAKICIGQSFTLNATLSSGYNNPVFQWQVSTDATNWTNISGATTTTYTLTPATSGIYYYRVLASESGNINLITCRIASTPTLVGTVTPYPDLVTSGTSICTETCTDLSTLFTDNTPLLPNSTVSIKYFNTLADAQADVNQLTSSVVCPTASRSYFVSKTVNGCNDILEIPITVKPLPAINASSNSAICQGQTLNLTTTNAGTGATYAWSGPNSFASTLQNPSIAAAKSTQNGTYSLTVTLNGCTATATTSVTVKPLPTVGASNNSPICQGQTLTLSSVNGGTGASYLWNGPSGYSSALQNPTISGITPASNGVYTSTVTLNGCTATATTNVAIKPLPNTSANSNSPVCVGNTLNLLGSGGVTGAIYQWSGPNNFTSGLQNPSITTVTTAASGTYSLNVILNGCSASSTTAVTINPLPTPTANSNSPVCVGKSLDLISSGGVIYAWLGPNGFTSSLQNPSINPASLSASGIYTVTVTNANGCSATATTSVVINALPVPSASSNTPVCVGKSLDLTSSGGVSYVWVGPNGFTSSLQNPNVNPVSISATGIYTITVTNANGCSSTATTNVVINAIPVPTASSNTPVCVGKSLDLTSSGGVSYTWVGPNGFTSSLQNPSINPVGISSSGVYTVTVTNGNGCSATVTTKVVINALPVPTASSNSPVCVGKSLDLTSSGGVSYVWVGPNGFTSSLQNPSINPASLSATGIYTVTVTNANGCSATATTSVVINSLPVPTASSNTPVCVGKSLDLTSNGGVGYAWLGPNGFVSSLQNPSINPVSISATGVYTVTVTNTNGCSATATANVIINALPIPTASSNTPVCVGKSLDLGSSGGVSYAWVGPNGFTSSLQNPSINPVSLSATGVYTVTVTNTNGCSATATANVIINALPIPTASSNTPVCVGKSLDLGSSGGVSYAWVGPNGFTSSLQNPSINPVSLSAIGIYTFTVTNANGCSATATTNVVINALPVPTTSSNTPVCVGKSLDLASSGGVSYSWLGPNGFTSSLQNPSINPASISATGIYTVTVTNANGCSATTTTSVIINALPVPTASSNTPVCVGKSLDLTSSGGVNYAWVGPNGFTSSLQNPSINPASISASGIYTVTVINANGCSATTTTSVIINALPVPTASSNTPVCVGKSLDLTSSGGVSYAWVGPNGFSSSLQNTSINPVSLLAAGIYTVTVTNATGCSATATTNVVINFLPVPIASSNTPVCVGKSLDFTSSGGVNYAWVGPNGFTSSLQNPSINSVSISATGIYTVTVTNTNGCSATTTTSVVINALPVPTASSNTAVCVGKSLDFTSSGGVNYAWLGPNGFTSSLQNPSINPVSVSSSGVYTVTVTNANGCSSTATTSVIINALPVPTASSNTPVCVGKSLDLASSGGVSYAWVGPNGFTSSSQNPSINPVSLSAIGIYTVTVTNANGCSETATTNVVINALPVPMASSNTPVCVGKSLDLTSSGGVNYAWGGPNGFASSLQNPSINPVSISATGIYTVTVTNANGCSATATTNVVINALPVPTVSSNKPVCVGKSLDLTSSGGVSYVWVGPNGFTSSLQNPSINPVSLSASGIYTVTVTNANGCSATATTSVVINALPVPSASSNTPVCVGKSLDLTSSGGVSYAWAGPSGFSSSLQNPSINPVSISASGIYTVTVTNANSCSATATTNVVINALPVPTASSNSPVCVGKSLDLTSSGGVSYVWVGPNGFVSSLQNPSINPVSLSATGIYTVTVTNTNGCSATATTNVLINPLPVALISSNSPVCETLPLNISAQASLGAVYAWSGPNGFSSTAQNPTIVSPTVANSGIYFLTVTSGDGCTATASANITIKKKPAAIASNDSPKCAGQNLQLNANNETGATYTWSGPNGFTSNLQNPIVTNVSPINTGIYQVIVDLDGCFNSATTSVTVYDNPVANPSSNSPVCEGQVLNFTAENAGAGATYLWTGVNGFTSNLQNPSLLAQTAINSAVFTLTVTQNGCITTASTAITIKPKPTISIPIISPLCATENINLKAIATNGSSFQWSGPNGFVSSLQNPVINSSIIASTGIYEVIVDLNGCLNNATTSITVNPKPGAIAMVNSPVCETESVNLTANNAGTGAIYSWVGPNNFTSNLQNPVLNNTIPIQSGIYTLTVQLGICFSTTTVDVTVFPKPTLTIGLVACKPNLKTYTVDFTSNATTLLTTAGTINNLGGNNYQIVGVPAGTNIVLTVKTDKNCIEIQNINAPDCSCPVVNAPVSNGDKVICEGDINPILSVNVGANETADWYSTPSGGSPLVDSTKSFTPTSTSPGTYTYYAETRNEINECRSATRTAIKFTIKPKPLVSLNANSPICETDSLKLTGNSSLTGVIYSWNGPNNYTSSLQNPVITNAISSQSGYYKLLIDLNGCKTADSVNVFIKPKPQPIASSNSPVCEGFPLNISANSIANASYKWSGPKAFTNENQNEIITNTIPACSGIYTLTVTLDGCVSTTTTQVVVNAKPKISTSTPKCAVDLATYSLKFIALGGTVSSTAGVIINDSLKNVPSGTNVRLYITSPEGCQDSVLVNAPDCLCPPLDASVSLGDTAICQSQPNPLLAVNVNTLAGETVDWYDAANGGNLLQGNSLTYNPSPTAAGTYTYYAETRRADITIRTCVSSTRTPVKLIIKPLPLATALNNSPICQEDSLKLEAVAVSGANFAWTGPNGFVANSEDTLRFPAKTSMSGIYNLTVELAGCISTATTEVLVKPLPDANALSNATFGLCENDTLTLTMPSATNPIDSYSWTGPNAYAATGQTVKIIPASPSLSGIYTLTTSLNGCKNQDTTNVLIKPLPLTIANNTSPVCEGDSVILSAADSPNATYEWFTPNGVPIGTGKRIVLTNTQPNQSGDYFVKVTLDGCSDTSRTNVIIKRKPIALASGNTVCAGESIVLNAQKDSTATYLWSGPLGFNATKKDTILTNVIVSQSGIYTLNVTLNGCTLSDTASVLVKPLPVTIALSNSPVCENAATQLTAENAGTNAKYAWVGPNNFNSTLQNPVLDSASVAKAGIYTVEITLDGCKQTDTTLVVVKPLPLVSITANTPICEDDTLKLSVSSLIGGTYAWSGPNNFTSSQNTVQIQKVSLNASGLYQVTVTKDACSKNDSVSIGIKPKPLVQILSNSPVCEQDSLQLTAANAGVNATYSWSGPNGFTSNIQNPTVSPMTMAKAGKYILQVNLDNCIEYDTTEVVVKPLPILALSSNLPVCAEDTLKLFTGNNQLGTTFKWSGPAGFSDTTSTSIIPNVSVQQSGLYQVTAVLNGCFKADSISVLIKPLPVAIASAKDDSLCVGETLELSAANAGIGANYSWEGPNGFISNEQSPVITPVTSSNAGKYILKVTLNNCEAKDTINIVVNPLPTLVIDSAKCTPDLKYYNVYYHASDSLVSSTAGIFENGILKNIPKDSLSVRLTVTTKFGCSINQEVTAPDCNCPVIAAPTMNIQDTTICRGSTLPIFKATAGNRQTADWYDSPSGGTKIFTGLSYSLTTSDTLYVQARDTVSNCKSNVRTKISLIINELPIANASANSPVCQGDSLELSAETVSGASYSWLGAGFTSTQQNPVINAAKVLDGGIYTLSVTLKGCVSTTTVNAIINPLPTLVIDSAKCTPDLKYYNVYYHASDSLVTSTAGIFENGILKNIPKDSLSVRLTVTTKFGCSISQEVIAPDCNCPVIATPKMNIQDTTICRGSTLPIFTATVGNRQTADWFDSPTGGTKIFTGLSYSLTTSDTLYVQARDTVSNCKSNVRTKVSLIINELPIVNATSNSPVCQGDSLKLSAETVSGASYSWLGAGFTSTQQNPIINPAKVLDGGIYTLTVTLKGCVSTTTVNAIVNPLPTLVIDSAKCTHDLKYYNVYYHASDSLVSSTAGIFENGILKNIPKDSLSVRLTVTTKFGCSISQEVTAPDCNCPVIAAPTMNIQDTTICRGDILPIFKAAVANRQTADWFDSPSGGTKVFTGLSYSLTTSDTLYVQARDTVSNCKSNVRTKVSLIINELPSFEVVGISAKCSGSVVENNGAIQLLTWASSNKFAYVKDSVFTENTTYQTASNIPTDGLIIKNIAGSPTNVWYTIRIFNPSGCFVDKKVLLKKTVCDCLLTPICTPFEVKKTKNRRVIP